MFRRLRNQLRAFVETAVNLCPGAGSVAVRGWYFAGRLRGLGAAAVIGKGFLLTGGRNVTIGDGFSCWRSGTMAAGEDGRIDIGARVALNANVYVNACGGGVVQIGNDVMIGPNVVIRSSDHAFADLSVPIRTQGHTGGTIVIEDEVWTGANATLVKGATIGRGAIVAAGPSSPAGSSRTWWRGSPRANAENPRPGCRTGVLACMQP